MKNNSKELSVLSQYFALSYLLLLINASVFLRQIHYINFATGIFAIIVYLSYCFLYLLPIFLILNSLWKNLPKLPLPSFFKSPWFTGILAAAAITFLQLLIYTDSFIFNLFGFHFNGFVWNLIFTKGGVESMGNSSSTVRSFILIVLFFLFAQGILLVLLMKAGKIKKIFEKLFTRRRLAAAFILLTILILLQAIAYGLGSFYSYRPVTSVAKAFPFYLPVTFRRLAKSFGITPPAVNTFNMKFREVNLQYPLKPITRQANHKNYNIIFLMAESLRADMLNPKVMPQTWAFSQKAIRFNQHYSGGNGTRMALFTSFYGLYGNYWFNFLEESKGPVLIDLLIKDNYQMNMFSSAKFSYPEFDKTIFAQLPPQNLHDSSELERGLMSWKFDRLNVDRIIDFMETRDKSRPFMTFMFFESPHANYYFPPENEICVPYLEEFNYAEIDLKKDMHLIKNRYINSCNHLDSQFARVLKYLEENSLLDSTIVILTGDHGEEFMEKGRWGHNSNFSEEQTRTPMVLWVPGQKARQVRSITSHLDIPATILNLLGVTNPPQDYSQGIDLLGTDERKFTVVSGWDTIAYVDNEDKAIFPMDVIGDQVVTTKSDVEVTNETAFYQLHQPYLIQIMKDMSRFSN